jgi:hypothetical protein
MYLELVNLLVNPESSDYELSWHRDMINIDASDEEEAMKLKIPHYGTQWNAALYNDDCLIIVPHSHNRIRTQEERTISQNDCMGHMPNEFIVKLKPGQAVFYNNNILHRAIYYKDQKRSTLHACMGTTIGGCHRAQNILQHGLEWMRESGFVGTLPDRLVPLYNNLIRLAVLIHLLVFNMYTMTNRNM